MGNRTPSLWEAERLTLEQAIALTIESLQAYGSLYQHWVVAYSGGKDSSCVVSLVASLIASGLIRAPQSLTVLYADTRMELPPLQAAALNLLSELEPRGIQTRIVLPALDDRFFVYMFGRGVPPPKNLFRWCTPQLKVEPMEAAVAELRVSSGEKCLMLTGVRVGESAARDQRIALACSKNGAECGQGWFQVKTPAAVADVLAPCLHWRVCHVWDWLTFYAPRHAFSTQMIAEVYGETNGLAQVLDMQEQVNQVARVQERPWIDLLNREEQACILALIAANTWPERWTGREVRGDELIPQVIADGVEQPLLMHG